ncbi:K(+)-transporting ATPase subunit C [Nocardiopsis coralliicola]
MLRQTATAIGVLLAATLVLGGVYPLAVTGFAQLFFPGPAAGSLVTAGGETAGSARLAQSFTGAEYFHPRPSAVGYDARDSGGSNLGPLDEGLAGTVAERAAAYREANGLAPGAGVPADAVTASGSGLDPHISPANARLQTARVAESRGIGSAEVGALVSAHTDGRALGVLGEPGVNVLLLNLALDEAAPAPDQADRG